VSSPTPPFTDPAGTAPSAAGPLASPITAELARREGSRAVDVLRPGPPEEVLQQMAHADAIHERLCERGYQIAFALSPGSSGLTIELRDSAGSLLRILSAEEAAELAAGGPLE